MRTVRLQFAPRHDIRTRLLLPNVATFFRTSQMLPVEVYSAVRGPAGSGAPDPVNFSFGSVSQSSVLTMPFAGVINEVLIDVETPFNGIGVSLAIGTILDPQALMPASGNAMWSEGAYSASPMRHLLQGDQIRALYSAGAGATQGAARIYFVINPISETQSNAQD